MSYNFSSGDLNTQKKIAAILDLTVGDLFYFTIVFYDPYNK